MNAAVLKAHAPEKLFKDLLKLHKQATAVQMNTFESVKDTLDSAAFCWLGPIFFLYLGFALIGAGGSSRKGA